jgi:pyruvate dehydrogenase E2 component (dihydrolipoamide acetyltransferase)
MDAAVELRGELKALAGVGPVPSFNDMIVRAAAQTLREHPKANGSYRDGAFELHDRVNIGIAVAAEDALVVPTIFDADKKSLGEIGRDSRRLAERVRAGEATPPELAGGTFTVSNLGMFWQADQALPLAAVEVEPAPVSQCGVRPWLWPDISRRSTFPAEEVNGGRLMDASGSCWRSRA